MAMKIAVVLPAAGLGRRFTDGGSGGAGGAGGSGGSGGAETGAASKIEMELAGKPVFLRAAELFLAQPLVGRVLLAVHPERVDVFNFRWGDALKFRGIHVVAGGTVERWQTVARALEHVPADCTHVAVHDAARPLTSPALIERVFTAAQTYPAVIPALPVTDTLKRVEALGDARADTDPLDAILGQAGKVVRDVQRVAATVDRAQLVAVQTPQVFEASLLRRAYAPLLDGTLDPAGITDDASLIEALGETVHVVAGDALNFKITRPGDAELAAALLEKRESRQQGEQGRKRLFEEDEEEE